MINLQNFPKMTDQIITNYDKIGFIERQKKKTRTFITKQKNKINMKLKLD